MNKLTCEPLPLATLTKLICIISKWRLATKNNMTYHKSPTGRSSVGHDAAVQHFWMAIRSVNRRVVEVHHALLTLFVVIFTAIVDGPFQKWILQAIGTALRALVRKGEFVAF